MQTYSDIELIVVDDGSNDGTQEFLRARSTSDQRIVCVQQAEATGAPAARNRAIRMARGDFVTGLDDDDWFHPERVGAFVEYWKLLTERGEQPSFLYSQDVSLRDGEVWGTSRKASSVQAEDMFDNNAVGNQIFAPKSRFLEAGLFNEQLPAWQDLDLFFRMLRQFGSARLLDFPTYYVDMSQSQAVITLKSNHRGVNSVQHRGWTMKLSDPIFTDAELARQYIEAQRWPDGPVCPHCGNADPEKITSLKGKAHRPGLYQCNECREQFTVMVGSVFERSKIPLNKWLLATFLLMSSKKGMSTRQIHRMLDLPHKTAWFMTRRIREALKDGKMFTPLGGQNKVIEADETFVGGKARNRAHKPEPKKHAVMALVEREGRVMSFHVPNVTAKTLRPIIVKHVNRASYLMTDEALAYTALGREFAGHGSVNHSADEYARATFWHINTAENFFSILKRGVYGVYHHVSEAHLHRYLAEFDFRYNTRHMSDTERTEKALSGIGGKRLMYQRPRQASHV